MQYKSKITDSFCRNCRYNLGADNFDQNRFCRNSGKLHIQFKWKKKASARVVGITSQTTPI